MRPVTGTIDKVTRVSEPRPLFAPLAVVADNIQEDLIALDEALTKLTDTDPQAARLIQLRYFVGLSIPDAAKALGISPRTADRLWAFARAWLHREIQGSEDSDEDSSEFLA